MTWAVNAAVFWSYGKASQKLQKHSFMAVQPTCKDKVLMVWERPYLQHLHDVVGI